MRTRLAALIALLFLGVSLVSVAGATSAHAKDMNCSDFNSQAAAQNYFENNGGGPNNNVDGLDADGDGTACESNPCPCTNYGGGGGGGGGGNNQPKPFHKLTAQKGKVDGITYAFGKVTTYKDKRIRILKQVGKAKFRFLKFAKTKADTGKFKVTIKQIGPQMNCFRVTVPATPKYRLTVKNIGCIPPS